VPDDFAFVTESLQLDRGGWICAVTDGITEAMNERGELYGAHRLHEILASMPADAAPGDIIKAVLEDVARFVGSAHASDDLTVLALRWL
jgi:sigma-B regulation protein RsbU (phosphoserine phosphatase)